MKDIYDNHTMEIHMADKTVKLSETEIIELLNALPYAQASHKRVINTTKIQMVKQGHENALNNIQKLEMKLKEAK